MEDDIQSAKQGAVSKGAEVTIPKTPPLPPLLQKPTLPKPSELPSRSPLVRIGEADKKSSLPKSKLSLPLAINKKPEHPKGSAIAIPPRKSGFPTKYVILAVVVAVLIGGSAYWFFVLREGMEPEVFPTFTPRVIATPNPLINLKKLFFVSNIVPLPDSTTTLNISAFKATLLPPFSDEQASHAFVSLRSGADSVKFSDFIKRILAGQGQENPKEVRNLLTAVYDDEFGLILSKQTEQFDSSGKPVDNFPVERRMALVVKVSDAETARQAMLDWEVNLPFDIEDLFELPELSGTENLVFQDNAYREVPIKYINFPYPDRTIDYAVITATDGEQYLVIANSRIQMYAIIDLLLGF